MELVIIAQLQSLEVIHKNMGGGMS